MKFDKENLIAYSILFITVSSVNLWMKYPLGTTFMWWVVYFVIICLFLSAKSKSQEHVDRKSIWVLMVFIGWNVSCIIRGFGVAENYWEWKNLFGTGFVLLLPLSIYVTANPHSVQNIISLWIRIALPGFFLMLPFFTAGDPIGRYLVPFTFLLLFVAYLPPRWRLISIAVAFFVILSALNARSNVIKFGVASAFGLLFYLRSYIPTFFWKFFRYTFLLTPVILFMLAISGNFNVFEISKYTGGEFKTEVRENNKVVEEDLTTDTRTDIYKEVIFSAIKNDYIWFGRTPARGNDSSLFGKYALDVLKTGKMERFSNEVSVLNIFTWTGIVGVCCYFLIFFSASYLAVYHSESITIKIIGLSVAFRWLYAWVEDFSEFDLSYFFLWVMIGMCFSKTFRAMNDLDFKYWIWGIFDSRYREVLEVELADENQVVSEINV